MSAATFVATSTSKPTSSPFRLRIAHGSKVETPTFSAPRFWIVSMTLSPVRCGPAHCARSPAATPSVRRRDERPW